MKPLTNQSSEGSQFHLDVTPPPSSNLSNEIEQRLGVHMVTELRRLQEMLGRTTAVFVEKGVDSTNPLVKKAQDAHKLQYVNTFLGAL